MKNLLTIKFEKAMRTLKHFEQLILTNQSDIIMGAYRDACNKAEELAYKVNKLN